MSDKHDHTTELVDSLTQSVLKRLLGSAIVARVRAEPALRNVLVQALVLSLLVGVLGHELAGFPISVCFWATLTLFGEAILQVHFAEIHELYTAWTAFRRQAYVILGLLFLMRLLVGQALGVPTPGEVYIDIQHRGGFIETLWNHAPPDNVLQELRLDIPLAIAAIMAVVKRSRMARGLLIATALLSMLLLSMPITQAAFQRCMATNGVAVCTFKLLFTGFKN